MSDWFYAPEGRTEGPVPLETLVQLLQGKLPPDTPVWRDGFSNWMPANAISEISVRLPPRPAASAPPVVTTAPAIQRVGAAGPEERSLNPFVVIRRSFSWRGRFTRGEYLMAIVANTVLALFLGIVAGVLFALGGPIGAAVGGILMLVYLVPSTIIGLGANVRRMNDLGLSPWFLLLMFVPLVNFVFWLYLLFAPTSPAGAVLDRTPTVAIVIAVLFGLMMVGGIVAAIAIPGLMRAREAGNAASAIGWLRTLNSAEAAYAASNGGLYEGKLECLANPSQCIPGYSGPSFLGADGAVTSQSGYTRQLFPGHRFTSGDLPQNASPSSTSGYVAIAVPQAAGGRSFCTDQTGTIFETTGLSADTIAEALTEEPWVRCNPAAQPLR